MRRSHLSGDTLGLVRRRIIVISLFCWLPLFVLAAVEGKLVGGSVPMPFLEDVEAHLRFLVAIPFLIGAELTVHQRMRSLLKNFLERNLIPESAMPQFDSAIGSAYRLRNSVFAEVLLITFVYVFGVLVLWQHYHVFDKVTWFATPTANGHQLSLAGIWYGYAALPVFQFLLLRWYYRIFIWIYFLVRVSRIDLSLVPTHPDRVGGLGFLANTTYAFVPLLLAHGTMAAGLIANRIFYLGAKLPDFQLEILILVIYCMCLVLGPLVVFAPQLARARLIGSREYGVLAERYTRAFDSKWLRGGAPKDESLLGSADIQSLADLANSFEIVRTMRVAPITRQAVLQLAAATVAPIVPLLLTIMPLDELLKKLLGILI
jgi:hypothetical protein